MRSLEPATSSRAAILGGGPSWCHRYIVAVGVHHHDKLPGRHRTASPSRLADGGRVRRRVVNPVACPVLVWSLVRERNTRRTGKHQLGACPLHLGEHIGACSGNDDGRALSPERLV